MKKLHFSNLTKWVTSLFILISVQTYAQDTKSPRLGVWVTVFTETAPFASKGNADKLIKTCKDKGIRDIYLQVYRSNKAYYDSTITDKTSFERNKSAFGKDPVAYILEEAKKNNIKVHAWINLLSIAANRDADIVKKFGDKILTVDRRGNNPFEKEKTDSFYKTFILENQIFLEPGDKRVRDYLVSIAREILQKYPDFGGIHLDYTRYPSAVPFAPGSRFDTHAVSYGYGDINTEAFIRATKLDLKTMAKTADNFLAWDNFRRSNVTRLVKDISIEARKVSPAVEISSAVVPSPDRAYLMYFQDWTAWIDDGLIDYAVLMTYTNDANLVKIYAKSVINENFRNKVFIGLGAYLLKNNKKIFDEEMEIVKKFSPEGIVIFSYDDIEELLPGGFPQPVHNGKT